MCSFIRPNRLVLTSRYLVLSVSCICLFQLFFISFCFRARENILISYINIWRFMEPFLEFRYVLFGFILTSKYNEHWINFIKTFYVLVMSIWTSYELRGEELYKADHRSYRRNFCICEKKACYYQLAPPSNSNWQNVCVIFPEQEEEIKKNVPDYVITHGILSKPDLEKLLQDTKVCISFLCIWSC